MSKPSQLGAAEFAQQVERRGTGRTLVDFYAEWCVPCRMIEPGIAALAEELAGELRVVKVDADAEPALVAKYGVRSLPTLMLFEDGAAVDTHVGAAPLAELRRFAEAREAGSS